MLSVANRAIILFSSHSPFQVYIGLWPRLYANLPKLYIPLKIMQSDYLHQLTFFSSIASSKKDHRKKVFKAEKSIDFQNTFRYIYKSIASEWANS
jgi:hypothetical protein